MTNPAPKANSPASIYYHLLFPSGFILLLLSAWTGKGNDIIVGDARDYYEYARSLVYEGRLPNRQISYPPGVSLAGLPLYAPVAFFEQRIRAGNGPLIEKGAPAYGLAPQAAFCASLILLSFLGFHCACKTLAFFGFGTADARLILILWILGTNIGYYIFKEPAMSEGSTYAFLTIYYYLLMARYNDEGSAAPRSRTILEWGLIGLVLGLAGIVRLQNIAHSVSVPLFIYGRWRRNRASVGDFWTAAGLPLLAATTVCAVIFSIPFEVWNLQGAGIETGVPKSSEFDFATPHVLRILFDPRQHGFLVWHPLFFAAGWGWFLQLRKNRFIALSLLVPAIIQFYLIASWRSYSFGASFGNRGFFTLMPLMLPFFAESIRWAAARPGRHNVFKIAAGILISWNLLLMLFYSAGILAPEGVRITWR